MSDHDSHDHGGHDHDAHGHGSHGHENDQGIKGMLRYLRWAPSMWRSDINTAVLELVKPQAGERVVDIGAGMGPGTVIAARAGAKVVAVEPTPFLRRVLAGRRLLQRSRGNIEVVDASAEQLLVDDASVDAVWAVNTMHHWVDPERGAAEIVRALRPGGRIVLVDENFTDPSHPEFERFGSDHADDDGDDHHHGFTMVDGARMGELLGGLGLVDIDASDRTLAGRPVIAVTARAAHPG